jgi:hypothetical protein
MMGGFPNYSEWLNSVWGWPDEGPAILGVLQSASNVLVGQNPPYTLQDFFALMPKWAGPPIIFEGVALTEGQATLTVDDVTGLSAGNPIMAAPITGEPSVPDGTTIQSISGNIITLSENAEQTGTVILTVWNAPLVPFAVISAYLYLAVASLQQVRWQELWTLGVALYVAHFLTLYAKSDGNPNATISQAAAQGLQNGIQVAKSVGGVSVSYQPVDGLEGWGAWTETTYGAQLVTFAKALGSGPMLVW